MVYAPPRLRRPDSGNLPWLPEHRRSVGGLPKIDKNEYLDRLIRDVNWAALGNAEAEELVGMAADVETRGELQRAGARSRPSDTRGQPSRRSNLAAAGELQRAAASLHSAAQRAADNLRPLKENQSFSENGDSTKGRCSTDVFEESTTQRVPLRGLQALQPQAGDRATLGPPPSKKSFSRTAEHRQLETVASLRLGGAVVTAPPLPRSRAAQLHAGHISVSGDRQDFYIINSAVLGVGVVLIVKSFLTLWGFCDGPQDVRAEDNSVDSLDVLQRTTLWTVWTYCRRIVVGFVSLLNIRLGLHTPSQTQSGTSVVKMGQALSAPLALIWDVVDLGIHFSWAIGYGAHIHDDDLQDFWIINFAVLVVGVVLIVKSFLLLFGLFDGPQDVRAEDNSVDSLDVLQTNPGLSLAQLDSLDKRFSKPGEPATSYAVFKAALLQHLYQELLYDIIQIAVLTWLVGNMRMKIGISDRVNWLRAGCHLGSIESGSPPLGGCKPGVE